MNFLYVFEDNYGHKHNLTKEISRGGQGAVFRTSNQNIAVKLSLNAASEPVLDDSQNESYNKIRLLPFPESLNITLPRAVLSGASGYIMELLDDMDSFEAIFNVTKYTSAENDWLKEIEKDNPECARHFSRYIASGGVRRRLALYMSCASLLARLHCAGLVYCDISSKNLFGSTDPEKSNVWLIDSDNVNYQRITSSGNNVCYTPGYAAPEVLDSGEMSMYSDCYAFAVSLFKDLTMTHPFMGKRINELCEQENCFQDEAENQVFSGMEPWICDTEDTSNAGSSAVPAELVFNKGMMGLFQRMFSEESRMTDPLVRPTMPEMAEGIAQLYDTTVRCSKCGMDSFFTGKCPWCDAEQKTLTLKSWYSVSEKKKRNLWEFARECQEGCRISVPDRLAKGFIPAQIDKAAFVVAASSEGYVLSDFMAEADVFVSEEGGDFRRVFGKYVLTHNSFTIRLENRNDSTSVIIEGGVVN